MGSLSIVASQHEYKICDLDEKQTLVTGINSYKNALTLFDRLTALQEIAMRVHDNTRKKPGSSR
ncbi:MAG: hypothetical protein HQL84_12140 [Magnetococcales bacterium]|nr:hypothetical protein [Magnetococcales bacterium]MBF0150784.1 hypothetical protein [Magnetococcales bacterium]MBF0174007.1 hypothetical protein [Magnetococcales bacterium]MBF0348776.1 hypothetical protein [Magnetococcales bacterium]MBF0631886.1 hypothetical protein [Magnetococcales bacterium]